MTALFAGVDLGGTTIAAALAERNDWNGHRWRNCCRRKTKARSAGSGGRIGTSDDPADVTPREMLASGDASTREAIDRAAQFLGIAVANVVTMLHPELVVLGGGVAELGEVLLIPVRDVVRQRVGMFPTAIVRIEKSQLGDRAGILGAVALAVRGGMI